MNKEELQAKRDEMFNHSEDTLARIKELDEQIKACDGLELRHGECYHDGRNSMVTIATNEGWCRLYDNRTSPVKSEALMVSEIEAYGYKSTGFMFPAIDDLKAMQEDVTEFEVSCCMGSGQLFTAYLSGPSNRAVLRTDRGTDIYLDRKDFSILILKLRQMEATLKRQEQ